MTNTNLLQAMGSIDPKLIADAAPDVSQKKGTIAYERKKKNGWLKWGAMAACFGLILITAMTVLPGILKRLGDVIPPPVIDMPGPVVSNDDEPNSTDSPQLSDEPIGTVLPQPPEEDIFISFESVDDLILTLNTNYEQGAVGPEGTSMIEVSILQNIADKITSEKRFFVPVYNNFDLPLKNVSNLANILVETNSVYGIPLIWYYAELDGANVIISTGVLSSEQMEQIGNGGIAAWKDMQEELLATLPDNPNADEVTITANLAQIAIGEKSILSSITQYSTDPRYHVEFILDNLLYVKSYIYPEDFDRGILKDLSFEVMTVQ